jgi:hypothetical protein
MEIAVLIEPHSNQGFRASCRAPFEETAFGLTREAALDGLRHLLSQRLQTGAEIVRLNLHGEARRIPHWPDDEFTRDWLAAIAQARVSRQPDAWETEP